MSAIPPAPLETVDCQNGAASPSLQGNSSGAPTLRENAPSPCAHVRRPTDDNRGRPADASVRRRTNPCLWRNRRGTTSGDLDSGRVARRALDAGGLPGLERRYKAGGGSNKPFQAGDNVFDRARDVSAWPSVRYWSVSTQSWRPLVLAVTAVDSAGRREGNAPQSLAGGRDSLFVERDENGGETTYRMRVLERSDHRMVVATDNVTPIKIAFVTAFEPGALQTVTFVQKEVGNSWSTYQIARVGGGGSSMASKHKGSFLNRLEAIRRYLAGQPTDQQPPLAAR
jgi:uncharacterized protein DUF6675